MRALCKEGHLKEALKILACRDQQGIQADSHTYRCLLQGCMNMKALKEGNQVHAHMIQNRFNADIFVWNTLVNMYLKCGSTNDAHQTFNLLAQRNVVTWNVMIAGFVQHGFDEEALQLFWKMKAQGVLPDEMTFLSTLKACSCLKAVEQGKPIHAQMVESGIWSNGFVGNTLIDMYAKSASLVDAHQIFNGMLNRTIVSWNVMISGFAQHGHYDEAFNLFRQMNMEGVMPDNVTFVAILQACVNIRVLEWGNQIHGYIIKSGVTPNIYITNSLVDMYAKCGSMHDACQVFDKMPKRDVISWNALITGYTLHGDGEKALALFQQLEEEGVDPDQATFVSSLKACTSLDALDLGRQIHNRIFESEIKSNILVLSTLVDMYAKCGSVEDAHKVFEIMPRRNVVTWNAVISGYAQFDGEEAFKLFRQMDHEGSKPNEVTFLSILKACTNLADLDQCKHIHGLITEYGFESDLLVGSTMVDVYSKCGSTEDAQGVFSSMPKRNVVSWNALIGGCVQEGHGEEALEFFKQMENQGTQPDDTTLVNVLNASASLAALDQGNQIYCCIIYCGKKPNIFIGNALIDMYCKCGTLDDAVQVFQSMSERDVVSWNALISGYAQHGHGKQALHFVKEMLKEGVKLNHITFVGILTACSHTGLVDEGQHYFDSMYQVHGILPTAEHFACMVDVYGRAGLLHESLRFMGKMPFQPPAVVWMALLGACRIIGNMEVALCAAEHILVLEPQNSAAFVLVSNIYAASGRWEDRSRVRRLMQDRRMLLW